jgi:hypothetical protein
MVEMLTLGKFLVERLNVPVESLRESPDPTETDFTIEGQEIPDEDLKRHITEYYRQHGVSLDWSGKDMACFVQGGLHKYITVTNTAVKLVLTSQRKIFVTVQTI